MHQALKKSIVFLCMAGLIGWCNVAQAEVSAADEALAKESAAYAAQTSKDPATIKQIMEKVKQGVAVLEKEGKSGFSKFQGTNSNFIFGGTYMWIQSLKSGLMLMHPLTPKFNGQRLLGIQDPNGKRFFLEMDRVAKKDGSGWIEYKYPKPGATTPSDKLAYVYKGMCDGEEIAVGCGVYDKTMADVKKELGEAK
jgi:signal transduction histidine kinase